MASIKRLETIKGEARYKVIWRDPKGVQKTKTFPSKAAADAWSVRVEASKLAGAYYDPAFGKRTFSEAYELIATRDIKPKTREGYRYIWHHYLEDELGQRAVGSLSRAELRAILADMPYGQPTVHACYRFLRLLLQECVEVGWLQVNPALALGLSRGTPRELRIVTPEEVRSIAEEIDARYSALVYVLAYGGLRFGEAAALERKDFDHETGRLSITKNLTEVAGKLSHGTPKTSAGRRVVRLPARVSEMLKMHASFYASSDLLFTTATGRPLRASNFSSEYFKPACRRAHLEAPLPRLHDLRHAMASIAAEAGIPLKAVQEALGHSSESMTAHYTHTTSALQDAFIQALEGKVL